MYMYSKETRGTVGMEEVFFERVSLCRGDVHKTMGSTLCISMTTWWSGKVWRRRRNVRFGGEAIPTTWSWCGPVHAAA